MRLRRFAAALLVCTAGLGAVACSSSDTSTDSGAVVDVSELGPEVAKLRAEVLQLREEVRKLREELATTSTTTTVPPESS